MPTFRRNLLRPPSDEIKILTPLRSKLEVFTETSMLVHHTKLVTFTYMSDFGLGRDPRLQNEYFCRNGLVLKLYENLVLGSAHIVTSNSLFVHISQVVEIWDVIVYGRWAMGNDAFFLRNFYIYIRI